MKKYQIETIEKAEKVCPIYLHSFDYGTIKYWAANTELPRNYLLGKGTHFDLEDVNKYATGLGYQDSIIYDYASGKQTSVIQDTKSLGMLVHVWTFKDDVILFNSTNNIVQFG